MNIKICGLSGAQALTFLELLPLSKLSTWYVDDRLDVISNLFAHSKSPTVYITHISNEGLMNSNSIITVVSSDNFEIYLL